MSGYLGCTPSFSCSHRLCVGVYTHTHTHTNTGCHLHISLRVQCPHWWPQNWDAGSHGQCEEHPGRHSGHQKQVRALLRECQLAASVFTTRHHWQKFNRQTYRCNYLPVTRWDFIHYRLRLQQLLELFCPIALFKTTIDGYCNSQFCDKTSRIHLDHCCL